MPDRLAARAKGNRGPETGARVPFQADLREPTAAKPRKTHGTDSIVQPGHVPTLITNT